VQAVALVIIVVVSFLLIQLQAVAWQDIFPGGKAIKKILTVVKEITSGKFGLPPIILVRKICTHRIGGGDSRSFSCGEGVAVVPAPAATAPVWLTSKVP